ncbi:MAG: diaminopimelate decarboxylase family protein [Candidatus Odinarchaeia archaeon]
MYLLKQYPHLKSDLKGNLIIENIRFDNITTEYNTPVYVYSINRIRENCRKLKQIINKSRYKNQLFYSYKTNLDDKILETIHQESIGAEATTIIELNKALKHNLSPRKIILDGPAKTKKMLKIAIKNCIRLINVDTIEEIKTINKIASKLKTKQEIGITLNPNNKSKIGTEINTETIKLLKTVLERSENVKITTLHCHMKTQNHNLEEYGILLEKLYTLSKRLNDEIGIKINTFDLGGGFPEAAIIGAKIDRLATILKNVKNKENDDITLLFEPGRFIVGDAGVLLTKIISIKKNYGKNWLIIDGGANILSPLTKANLRFVIADKLHENYSTEFSIGGPLPASFDIMTRNYPLPPRIKKGDIVAILNAGAYSTSFALDFGEREIKKVHLE